MTLDAGLFCVVQHPGTVLPPQDGSGLPGVRISVAPQAREGAGAPQARAGAKSVGQVTIRGLHDDGWLGPVDGAALVRVVGGAAQILITVYQSPDHPAEAAPRLQVVPLTGAAAGAAPAPVATARSTTTARPAARAAAPAAAIGAGQDIVAHIQRVGDVGASLGDWLGTQGSKNWIEGFGITPQKGISAEDIEYQAVLGRDWLSPWATGGKFCGSRGMALPLLGFNLRLRGKAAAAFTCNYSASFVDGTRIGPLRAGQVCETPSISPLEAFQIILSPLTKGAGGKANAKGRAKPAAKPAAKSAKKPLPARKRGR